jgi:hypothetical protein
MTSYSTFVQTTTQKILNEYKQNAQNQQSASGLVSIPVVTEPVVISPIPVVS